MVAMSLPNNLHKLLQRFSTDFPDISFVVDKKSSWDAHQQKITYNPEQETVIWSLLHELGHMKAGHTLYRSDVELLIMESEAWALAKQLGSIYGYRINQDYIEDCIDSYRDWLHRRSTCPVCKQNGAEAETGHYRCINCGDSWNVSRSRFCRVYRKRKMPHDKHAAFKG